MFKVLSGFSDASCNKRMVPVTHRANQVCPRLCYNDVIDSDKRLAGSQILSRTSSSGPCLVTQVGRRARRKWSVAAGRPVYGLWTLRKLGRSVCACACHDNPST